MLQLYFNKGRESTGYVAVGFSLSRFQRAQHPFILNSQPHVVLFLSPLAEVPGRYMPGSSCRSARTRKKIK